MMIATPATADTLPRQLGLWSALVAALTMIIFTTCFVTLFMINPIFTWTNLTDYMAFARGHPTPLPDLARFMMLIYVLCYVVLLNCIHERVTRHQQFLVRISLCFGVAFAALTGANYFVHLSTVRVNLAANTL